MSSTVLYHMNQFGKISVCGAIAAYNSNPKDLPKGKKTFNYNIQSKSQYL